MTPYRQPPWMKIYLGHAIGTAVLGMLLLSSNQTKKLHPYTQPILEWFPGAISISKQAPDPVSTQVFLVISMLIAAILLIWAVGNVSRGGYHTKTFDSQKERWTVLLFGWALAVIFVTCLWNVSYSMDGAQTRAYFFIKVAISSKFGVLTAMNQLIVGLPLFFIVTTTTAPFCIKVRA